MLSIAAYLPTALGLGTEQQEMGEVNEPQQYDDLAKRWREKFSQNCCFEDDIPLVEIRKNAFDWDYNDIEIFMRDHDDDDGDEDCAITDIKEFCRDVKLEILNAGEGTAGSRRAAYLDDRSARENDGLERVRSYDQPLAATGLYKALKEKVCN